MSTLYQDEIQLYVKIRIRFCSIGKNIKNNDKQTTAQNRLKSNMFLLKLIIWKRFLEKIKILGTVFILKSQINSQWNYF